MLRYVFTYGIGFLYSHLASAITKHTINSLSHLILFLPSMYAMYVTYSHAKITRVFILCMNGLTLYYISFVFLSFSYPLQLEWVTGGTITAGFHEVIISEETARAIERAKAEARPLWRVSSTLFGHVASDRVNFFIKFLINVFLIIPSK